MTSCDCCDHPLEHAITRALNVAENLGAKQALAELREDLETWREGRDA